MITIQTQSDGVLFNFQDSTRYLYGDGSILTPYNSLTLIADESNVLTFRKSASNDIFITAGYDELGYSSKEEAINDLKTKLFKATGGGGSESGITSGEVQTMIDNSLEDYYTDDEVDAALSEKQDALRYYTEDSDGLAQIVVGNGYLEVYDGFAHLGVGNTELKMDTSGISVNDEAVATQPYVAASVSGKADTTAVTAVNNALTAHTSDTGIHVSQLEKDAWNAKLDASAYTPVDLSEYWTSAQTEASIEAATSGKADTSAVTAVNDALTAHTADTDIHVTQADKTSWNAKAEPYSAGTGIEISGNVISATGGGGATYSAGTNISIDTANTINCTIPAYFNSDERRGDIAIGTNINNVNSDYYKVVIGRQIDTYGNANSSYSIGIGPATNNTSQYSQLKGNNSVGIGKYFQITAHQSVAIGSEAKSSVVGGVAIGYGVEATGTTKMNLNNQIKVDTNNQIYIKDKTNTTDVCIQDAIAALGGLKLVKLTQSEYDQLATKDPDTLYIITNVVS